MDERVQKYEQKMTKTLDGFELQFGDNGEFADAVA